MGTAADKFVKTKIVRSTNPHVYLSAKSYHVDCPHVYLSGVHPSCQKLWLHVWLRDVLLLQRFLAQQLSDA